MGPDELGASFPALLFWIDREYIAVYTDKYKNLVDAARPFKELNCASPCCFQNQRALRLDRVGNSHGPVYLARTARPRVVGRSAAAAGSS